MTALKGHETPANSRRCRVCGDGRAELALDLGSAAVCSRYLESAGDLTPRFPFRLGACRECGVIQLLDTPDIEWLKPPTECSLFRDPERHLDDLCAAMISQLPNRDGLVLGLSYKDIPVLNRFRDAGFTRTVVLDRTADWQLTSPRDGIETMQQTLTPDWAQYIRDRHGAADFLCVRHMLEHAQNVAAFLAGCRRLLVPGGFALFETPGCETELARGDAGLLWEEHVLYFTPTTLLRGLKSHAFHCRWVGNYPYSVEDCLAAFGQFGEADAQETPATDAGQVLLSVFQSARQCLRSRLEECAARVTAHGRKLALWGAGHRTSTFVELLPAKDLIACVIDDDPGKQGRFLPGSNLPILSADALSTQAIGACVGMLNPDVLRKIAEKHGGFTTRGGRFLTLSDLAVATDVSPLLS